MLNNILPTTQLFFISVATFFIFFIIRHLLIKTKLAIFGYHFVLFSIFFVLLIGGGGVLNDGYDRLEKFMVIENNGKLNDAKQNPQHYDAMLNIDFNCFKNSGEFKEYLTSHENSLAKVQAQFMGWFIVLMFDLIGIFVHIARYGVIKFSNNKIRKNFFSHS